jgi:diguanylate cyclase (GGDEF)-like protein
VLNDPTLTYAIVGRFGGEEFALVLPEAGTQQAEVVAERLRCATAAAYFTLPSLPTPLQATASFGVATFPDHGDSLDQLIQQADTALFQAKAKGKNCVVSAADLQLFWATEQESSASLYQAAFALTPPLRVQQEAPR